MGRDDETGLIEAAQAGDRTAFGQLVERYRAAALVQARRTLGKDAAEDAVQDAFLMAFRAIKNLEEPGRFAAWLAAIIRHRASRIGSQESRSLPLVTDLALETPSTPCPEIGREIERLPEPMRQCITLYYFQELGVAEIAAFLELPATTVKWNLHAARATLRRRLGPEYGAEL